MTHLYGWQLIQHQQLALLAHKFTPADSIRFWFFLFSISLSFTTSTSLNFLPLPLSPSSESPYEVFTVQASEAGASLAKIRHKRELPNLSSVTKYPKQINLAFRALGQSFTLHLERNRNLFSKQFTVREELNQTRQERITSPQLNCFYQGHLISHPNSSAAISLCNGMVSSANIPLLIQY